MKSPTMLLMVLGTIGAVTLASASADAQRVRTFDDQVESSGEQGVAIPGAPAPEPQPAEQPQQAPADSGDAEADGDGSDEDGASMGTYQISVHQSGATRRSGLEERLSQEPSKLYQGIIPGQRDVVAHLERARAQGSSSGAPNQITWVGFQPEEDRTRIFFQSPRPVNYELREAFSDGELIVTFENARIAERNFSRFIDTSHFGRVVERIETAETRGGNVEVTLTVSDSVEPSISTDGEYLYFDFPQ